MSWESLFECIGLLGTGVALFYLLMGGRHAFTANTAVSLMIVLGVGLIKYSVNAAEWSGVFESFNLDYAEDYLDDMWPFAWFLFFFTAMMDMSAEKIRQNEKHYRMLFNNTMDAILVFDEEGNIVNFNAAALHLTGYDSEELVRIRITDILPAFDPAFLQKTITQQTNHCGIRETTLCHKKGQEIASELTCQGIQLNGRKGLLAVARDITEKRRREEEMMRIEKLEALGIMAGGIAHAFNNFLMGILGNVSLMKFDSSADDKTYQRLEEMEKAALRSRDLTQQLLTFAKGGDPVKKPSHLVELIEETTTFALRGSNVRPQFQIQPSLYPAEIDRGQIGQVISNLVLNADQAMPEGGVLRVEAKNEEILTPNSLNLPSGSYLKITFKDNGVGISKAHLGKIFDPYFSTKAKGSGLGLAVALSVIRKHHGDMTVTSETGEGSTFSIYLPASKEMPVMEETQVIDPTSGKYSILLMDDEDCVRETIAEMLEACGFEVDTSEDGEEAVAAYRKAVKNGKPYDVVIMDLTIPGGMGGKEAIRELLKIDPNVKAVVSSGYSNDPVMSNHKEYGFRAVLQKPYLLKDLKEVLHRLTASASP